MSEEQRTDLPSRTLRLGLLLLQDRRITATADVLASADWLEQLGGRPRTSLKPIGDPAQDADARYLP